MRDGAGRAVTSGTIRCLRSTRAALVAFTRAVIRNDAAQRRWAAAGVVLLVLVGYGMALERASRLAMPKEPAMWAIDAIVPALSELLGATSKRYVASDAVDRIFREEMAGKTSNAVNLNAAIAQVFSRIRADQRHDLAAYHLLGTDDKGIVDFVRLSVVAFGSRVESITTLYFVVLLASTILFLSCFGYEIEQSLIVGAFFALFYTVLPMLKYNPQLGSVLALRVFPIVSMIACLHAIRFALSPRFTPWAIAAVSVQCAIIVMVLHIRATALWQIAAIGLAAAIGLLAAPTFDGRAEKEARPGRSRARLRLASLLPAVVLGLGLVSLSIYRKVAFPAEYQRGDQITTRVFWHNIFSGLAYSPMLADKYKLRIDDLSVIAATGAYLREKGRDAEWVAMGGTQPNFKIRYAPYDLAVRDMLFDRCRNEMAECLAAFFYYKPLSLLKNLAWLYGFRLEPPDTAVFASRYFGDVVERQFRQTSAILNQKGERPALFDVPGVILCILGSLLIVGRLYNPPLARAFVGCGIFLIASLAPTIVGYPGMHTIASTGIAVGIAIYFITIVALAAGWRAAGQRVAARA